MKTIGNSIVIAFITLLNMIFILFGVLLGFNMQAVVEKSVNRNKERDSKRVDDLVNEVKKNFDI